MLVTFFRKGCFVSGSVVLFNPKKGSLINALRANTYLVVGDVLVLFVEGEGVGQLHLFAFAFALDGQAVVAEALD